MHKDNYILFVLKEGFINPLFLLLLLSFSVKAQQNKVLSDDLFNFNHQNLQSRLEFSPQETALFYTNKITFLQVLFNETPLSDSIIEHYEHSISTLENHSFKPSNLHLKTYYIGEAQLMLSLLQMKQGHQISSAKNFIKAYDSFETNLKKYPNFKDPIVALKFMEISASILPKSLQWITAWFGVKSNKDQAVKTLTSLYQSNQLSELAKHQCYALSLYLHLQFNISIHIKKPVETSTLVHLLHAEIYGKNKKYSLMITTLLQLPNHLYLKHFLLGKAYFITENPQAKRELIEFISTSRSKANTSAAYFYLYQINIINQEAFVKNRALTLAHNPEQNYRDKWAKKEITLPQTAFLIRIRNTFDRGDYQLCIQLLNNIPTLNTRELYYLTNSYIYLGKIKKAKQSYSKLLKQGFNNQYYIPKTGYHLAETIYEQEPDYAISLIKAIRVYKDYPYQKEIETKSERILKHGH